MAKYKKKPVVIDAVQWNGNMEEIIAVAGHGLPTHGPPGASGSLRVATLEGDMELRLGSYLIKGVGNELYPCRSDIFEATYELVSDNLPSL